MQTTEYNVKEMKFSVAQRISDAYLKFADEIKFYHRSEVNQEAKLAATWTRRSKKPTLEVSDPEYYQKIKDIHNVAIKQLGRLNLLWESTVEAASRMKIIPQIPPPSCRTRSQKRAPSPTSSGHSKRLLKTC